jgi:peptidoglycan/LPS O-acetylase OafA/YrhL
VNNKKFYTSLTGLRGIAALLVACSHSLVIYSVDGINDIWKHPWNEISGVSAFLTKFILIFLNGSAAVFIFFILSAVVLQQSLQNETITIVTICRFTFKRLARLYPIYIIILGITIFYQLIHTSLIPAYTSEWFHMWFKTPMNKTDILKNIFLIDPTYSGVAWTLKIEFLCSLCIPFFLFAKNKFNTLQNILFLSLLFLLSFISFRYLDTRFFYIFYLSLFISDLKNRIRQDNIYFFIAISIICLLLPQGLSIPEDIKTLIQTFGAFGVVCMVMYYPHKIFSYTILQKLGEISYPFYLLHFIILYALAEYCNQYLLDSFVQTYALLLNIALMLMSIIITIPLAYLLHNVIEKKSIKLSNYIWRL